MPERNDDLVQALHVQQNELNAHIQAIDDLLTHYETPEKILIPLRRAEPTKTYKRSPKRKKVKNTGGRANKKTDQEIAAMGKMFSNGVPIRDISKKLGVSDVTVYKYAKLNKWKRGEE